MSVTTLRIEMGGHEEPLLEWADHPGRKLESQLTEIVCAIVRRAEARLRWHEQWRNERQCDRRREELEAIEKRRIEAERRRLEAIAAHREKVRDEVIGLAKRRREAEDIRATVAELRSHPELATTEGRAKFDAWAANALTEADKIDPMNASLDELFGSFSEEG